MPFQPMNAIVNFHCWKYLEPANTARRLFPGATVYLQDINSNCKNKNTVKSVPSVWFKPKKCDFYASYRISAKQLSKHYIKQIFEDSLKNPKSSEYFFRDHSGISIEIGQLEAKPCSLCNHEQRCNPESKILCSCEALASNCIDYPILGAFRNFDEFEYYNFEDSLRAYRNEEKYSRDSNEMFSSCPSDQEDLCMTLNSTCVPARDLISYTCECKYPYIGTNGTCQRADEVQGRVYQINLPLRSDSPWSKELANPLSHRYQRMKRNAERFLKAMFPGFSSSVLGFEAGTSKSRVIDSEVSLNFIITADKDFTEKDIISLLQKSQQNDGEVTIPGISFSALVDPSFISVTEIIAPSASTTTRRTTTRGSETTTTLAVITTTETPAPPASLIQTVVQAIFNFLLFGPLAVITVLFNIIQSVFSGFGGKRSLDNRLFSVNRENDFIRTLIKIRENELFPNIIETLGRRNDWKAVR
ncbi:uncharacterized protein LOC136025339 isoform X2 [Artemia franciscana]|uniref:uncharacterized protein LOC136025339 isoform X2 n=1 Tax=Artemia franciscana TaxID=6661 RepID=UPI0032DA0C1A